MERPVALRHAWPRTTGSNFELVFSVFFFYFNTVSIAVFEGVNNVTGSGKQKLRGWVEGPVVLRHAWPRTTGSSFELVFSVAFSTSILSASQYLRCK